MNRGKWQCHRRVRYVMDCASPASLVHLPVKHNYLAIKTIKSP